MAVNPPGNNTPSLGSQFGNQGDFKAQLSKKSGEELVNLLSDPKLTENQKTAAREELVSRLQKKQDSGETPPPTAPSGKDSGSANRLDELLKKLLSGEKLSPEEMEELKKMLKSMGLSDDQISKMIEEAQKGSGTQTDSGDLTGG